MKILGTTEYIDEKLNIKPLSKDALKNASDALRTDPFERYGWKRRLESGDVVVVTRMHENTNIPFIEKKYRYVSYKDYMKYEYDKLYDFFKLYPNRKEYIKNGILIGYGSDIHEYLEKNRYCGNDSHKHHFLCIDYFGDERPIAIPPKPYSFETISVIYRPGIVPKQPFYDTDINTNALREIYNMFYKNVNEKLNIQPISSERLKNTTHIKSVKIGNKLWSAENAKILFTNDGEPLVEGNDYIEVNGEIFYSMNAAKLVIPKGWRIPTLEDCYDLLDCVSDRNYLSLVSKEYGGSDELGFCAKLIGVLYDTHRLGNDKYTEFWVEHYYNDILQFGTIRKPLAYMLKVMGTMNNPRGNAWTDSINKSNKHRYRLSLRFCKDK